ncbi:hypothetical protein [Metapseudomonas otitidis]|uniref:hypothetical protein n=1 Tax=Metapseudomonas otitidis TaxID=319939 RepID=UPI0013F59BFA|nr:hypothetical protein [Pseudomonas otitidis]
MMTFLLLDPLEDRKGVEESGVLAMAASDWNERKRARVVQQDVHRNQNCGVINARGDSPLFVAACLARMLAVFSAQESVDLIECQFCYFVQGDYSRSHFETSYHCEV